MDHSDFKDSDFEDDGQPKMASEIGISYISKATTDRVDIPTANLGFMIELEKSVGK